MSLDTIHLECSRSPSIKPFPESKIHAPFLITRKASVIWSSRESGCPEPLLMNPPITKNNSYELSRSEHPPSRTSPLSWTSQRSSTSNPDSPSLSRLRSHLPSQLSSQFSQILSRQFASRGPRKGPRCVGNLDEEIPSGDETINCSRSPVQTQRCGPNACCSCVTNRALRFAGWHRVVGGKSYELGDEKLVSFDLHRPCYSASFTFTPRSVLSTVIQIVECRH